ncbi:hypothetical protein GCM10023318_37630 [Nocardia callitridis]|uniref:Uncharacterized protein n=1 Tax=Nocardia callitridis TaxID=648753 RepID=A0ABP9KL93_9NOCA
MRAGPSSGGPEALGGGEGTREINQLIVGRAVTGTGAGATLTVHGVFGMISSSATQRATWSG